jgi:hypothetical protein
MLAYFGIVVSVFAAVFFIKLIGFTQSADAQTVEYRQRIDNLSRIEGNGCPMPGSLLSVVEKVKAGRIECAEEIERLLNGGPASP